MNGVSESSSGEYVDSVCHGEPEGEIRTCESDILEEESLADGGSLEGSQKAHDVSSPAVTDKDLSLKSQNGLIDKPAPLSISFQVNLKNCWKQFYFAISRWVLIFMKQGCYEYFYHFVYLFFCSLSGSQ